MTSHESSSTTLTVLFTDVVGSTQLWESFPAVMRAAMERHDQLLGDLIERFHGRVIKSTGDGLMAVFGSAANAVTACVAAQKSLGAEPWGEIGSLLVRMGTHAGELPAAADDYLGQTVNRASRIMAVAHGGQILASAVVVGLAEPGIPDGVGFRDMGEHRLKDLLRPERLFQVTHASLVSEFPPLATLRRRPNNLPTQVSEFLGRRSELGAIRDLLDRADVRLLTITGPGGIGKTRLALQVGADQIERFEDGVFFVDLSPAREPDDVFDAIIRVLDLSSSGDASSLEILGRGLANRELLLILDNFEQVVEAAANLAALLEQVPGLTSMVTSRQALRVRGEHLFPVPPLSLPKLDAPISPKVAGESEAVQLFIDRVMDTHPDFVLTDENIKIIAEICARLDGLPLAIELAAARLNLFSPIELRDRLQGHLELLGSGPRDAPERHQTLSKTIRWSYDLLNDEEQVMLKVLSVFTSAPLEAVEAVAARLDPLQHREVLDLVSSLVDKSLVRSLDVDGQSRLSMLETIRQFAVDRLDDTAEFGDLVRRLHADYYAELASGWHDLEQESALDDLESELGNLTTAWRYWTSADDIVKLEQLYDALWDLNQVRGWYRGAIDLTRDLLAVLRRAPPSAERTRKEVTLQTSLARGLLATVGYTDEVEETYQGALALAEEVGDLPLRFPVLRSLASFHLFRGEFDRTVSLGAEFVALAEKEGDVRLQVEGHFLQGSSLAFLGDVDAGLDHLDQAISRFGLQQHGPGVFRLGANAGIAAHTTAALLLWLMGDIDRAEERARAAISLSEQLGHPFTLAFALFHVAFLRLWRRQWDDVRDLAERLLELSDRYDYQIWSALGAMLEGVSTVSPETTEKALDRIDQGVARYEGLRTPPVFWPLVLYLRAAGFSLARRPRQGLELIDEAIIIAGRGFLYPEFALLKGDLAAQTSDTAQAQESFRSSFSAAAEMGMRMSQLRAATRRARLSRPSGTEGALSELRGIYETFNARSSDQDILEARLVLDHAGSPTGSA